VFLGPSGWMGRLAMDPVYYGWVWLWKLCVGHGTSGSRGVGNAIGAHIDSPAAVVFWSHLSYVVQPVLRESLYHVYKVKFLNFTKQKSQI
jgi:hypothetical protein